MPSGGFWEKDSMNGYLSEVLVSNPCTIGKSRRSTHSFRAAISLSGWTEGLLTQLQSCDGYRLFGRTE